MHDLSQVAGAAPAGSMQSRWLELLEKTSA